MKRSISVLLVGALLLSLCACGAPAAEEPDWDALYKNVVHIDMTEDGVRVDDTAASADPSGRVYTAKDIVYYESGRDFTYGEGTAADAHTPEDAAAHTVVHITQPGRYLLTGSLYGQVAVDLGEDAREDRDATVVLILGGVDITCTVAPAVMFYNVYESGRTDGDGNGIGDNVLTGAQVIIADGTENTVRGSYVARIYDSVELSEDGTEVVDSKKLHKYDGAFYSKQSLHVFGGEQGDGKLTILAENEGLNSECHLSISGGNIAIRSGNDGINVNEDGVSVFTMNSGTLDITVTGTTGEGDGIDSNGWITINGGDIIARACGSSPDSGLDADNGIVFNFYNGGSVISTGHMPDEITEGDYTLFRLREKLTDGVMIEIENETGELLGQFAHENDWSVLLVAGEAYRGAAGLRCAGELVAEAVGKAEAFGGMGRPGGRPPEGFDPANMPEGFGPVERPEGMERPQGMQPPNGFGGKNPPGKT